MKTAKTAKTVGRPRVGATAIMVKMPPPDLAALDAWIKAQNDPQLTRPAAMRRLTALGMASPMGRARVKSQRS